MKKITSLVALLFISYTTIAQEYPTGLEFSKEKYDQVLESAPILTRSYTSLPSSYSLKAYAPTPGNQGAQPSCVGWASGYGARTIAHAIKNTCCHDDLNQCTINDSKEADQCYHDRFFPGCRCVNVSKRCIACR